MRASRGQPPESGSAEREQYTFGYTSSFAQVMGQRTAAHEASFLLTHLRSGMKVIDCGCGPGGITVGLVGAAAPGQVVGIDIEPRQVERAQAIVKERHLSNLQFLVGSIYEIPFPDASFDAALVHAVLEHLREPLKALNEVRRVLKPGGAIGISSPDQGGHIQSPPDPLLERTLELIVKVGAHNGGNRLLARHFRGLLRQAEFTGIEASAHYNCHANIEETRWAADAVAGLLSQPPFPDQVTSLGWASRDELDQMAAAWRAWGEHPDAFLARAWCTAVGWKE